MNDIATWTFDSPRGLYFNETLGVRLWEVARARCPPRPLTAPLDTKPVKAASLSEFASLNLDNSPQWQLVLQARELIDRGVPVARPVLAAPVSTNFGRTIEVVWYDLGNDNDVPSGALHPVKGKEGN